MKYGVTKHCVASSLGSAQEPVCQHRTITASAGWLVLTAWLRHNPTPCSGHCSAAPCCSIQYLLLFVSTLWHIMAHFTQHMAHITNKTLLVKSNVRCSNPSKRIMNPYPRREKSYPQCTSRDCFLHSDAENWSSCWKIGVDLSMSPCPIHAFWNVTTPWPMNDHRRTELLELFIHHIKLGSGFRSTINVWTIIIRLVYGMG